jgi:prolyl oligopeptidase
MSRFQAFLLTLTTSTVLTLLGCQGAPSGDEPGGTAWRPGAPYPEAARLDVIEDFFGTPVADPYRWLEELGSEETRAFVEAQNHLSFPFLASIPARDRIKERLTEVWNYQRYGVPTKEGGLYFYQFNPGLLNQDLVYVTDSIDAEPRLLIDPNTFSEDATIGLVAISPSPDGEVLAYATSDGGSDWKDWHFRDVATGEDLADELTYTKFTTPSWTPDSSGVFYSRYPESADGSGDDTEPVRVYFHAMGTPQSEDRLVYDLTAEPLHQGLDPKPHGYVTEDGRYLIITVYAGSHENQVHVIDLRHPQSDALRLIGDWQAWYQFIGNDGSVLYFKTTDGAPNSRVIAIDVDTPDRESWRELLPEADEALEDASYVGGVIVAEYLKDAKSLVRIYGTDGRHLRDLELPGIGAADGFEGHADDPETFFSFTGFTTPSEIHALDVASGESRVFKRPTVPIDTSRYQTRQVFYTSGDGTKVPMFIVHRRGIELDGDNPTLLYGYGGFGVSETPKFSISRMVWMELGGVFALANIRGGGEYGKRWHLAGIKQNKQNVFDDFIAAAEWLISSDYTSAERLAIHGGSNGGLLVAACAQQRPDLFGAVLNQVGVLDMIRYHLPSANARNWSTDYGLSENEDEFRAQIAYSPYHTLEPGTCYPPMLITTADHDDRVEPWHSYKYAAALQHAQGCEHPILLRVETRAGHSAGKPTWMSIEEIADSWAFLVWALDM